jgi:BirA family transcriptional regulator, biotin operon repressor / biotin---[acetyl-CoA-carboxylase] ligase
VGDAGAATLGHPHLHLQRTDPTNERARSLALAGAPHGTLVTALEQTAGRGRQGRSWSAPPGSALLCSLVLRHPPELLSLIAGVAVCDAVGARARLKWPNDVVVEITGGDLQAPAEPAEPAKPTAATETTETTAATAATAATATLAKLAGILVEGRPQEGWAVLGIGLNVAVRLEQLPAEVRTRAASLELPSSAIEPIMERLLDTLRRRLAEPVESVLEAWRTRDALRDREISWGAVRPSHPAQDGEQCGEPHGGHGLAQGIDGGGRLLVTLADGTTTRLDAGEIHLEALPHLRPASH